MTTQTNGDELDRQKFEVWATAGMNDLHKMIFVERFENTGNYTNGKARSQWEAWQAALSSKQEEA